MSKQEFSGKTVEEALDDAARTLGVDRSALSYSVISQAKAGLLSKLFSRTVRIEAWVESADDLHAAARQAVREVMGRKSDVREDSSEPRTEKPSRRKVVDERREPGRKPTGRQPEGQVQTGRELRGKGRIENRDRRPTADKKPKPRPPRREVDSLGVSRPEPTRVAVPLESPQVAEVFEEFKLAFLKSFEIDGEKCLQNRDEKGNLTLTIQDGHLEELLARSDRLSLAFEHIFKRLAQKRVGDVEGRVFLSAGNADEVRQEALRTFAFSLAEKVKKTGKSITVASKTSQERRVIHLTLDGVPGVATRSKGSGDRRKLIVFSTDQQGRARSDESDSRAESMGARSGSRGRKRRDRGRSGERQRSSGGEAPGSALAEE